jgi:hypothetical protein
VAVGTAVPVAIPEKDKPPVNGPPLVGTVGEDTGKSSGAQYEEFIHHW